MNVKRSTRVIELRSAGDDLSGLRRQLAGDAVTAATSASSASSSSLI